MQKIIEFFKSNKVLVGIGASTAVTFSLFYYLTQDQTLKKLSYTQTFYEQKAKEYASLITIKKANNKSYYEFDTIKQVYLQVQDLYLIEANYLCYKNRKERRDLIEIDIEAYKKLMLDFSEELQVVYQRAFQFILQNFNITKEEFILQQVNYYKDQNEQGRQEHDFFMNYLENECKNKMNHFHDLNISQAVEIIQFWTSQGNPQTLHLLPLSYQKLIQSCNNSKLKGQMVKCTIQDQVYHKYGIEEEDIVHFLSNKDLYEGDAQLIEIANSYQEYIKQPQYKINIK